MRLPKAIIITGALVFLLCHSACAYTTEHHVVNMSRDLVNMIAAPFKAVFLKGPQAVKKMYHYEVHGREKPENRRQLLHKMYAIVSAPAVETKAVIDGVVSSVIFAGKFFKEFLSIPFSD
jgi:hypothetical protein